MSPLERLTEAHALSSNARVALRAVEVLLIGEVVQEIEQLAGLASDQLGRALGLLDDLLEEATDRHRAAGSAS